MSELIISPALTLTPTAHRDKARRRGAKTAHSLFLEEGSENSERSEGQHLGGCFAGVVTRAREDADDDTGYSNVPPAKETVVGMYFLQRLLANFK